MNVVGELRVGESIVDSQEPRAKSQERMAGSALSPFAAKMLTALQGLTKKYEPHPCGGFTTDDMQWRMGTAFTPDETLWEALDELTAARLIRHCGDDDDDAIGACYEMLAQSKEAA